MPEQIAQVPGNIVLVQDPGPDGVIHIVMDVGYLVAEPDDLSFQRRRVAGCPVVTDTVTDLPGKIQTSSILFQLVDNAETLLAVPKAQRTRFIQCPLSGMTERRVAEVMTESYSFDKILIQH